jgi:hypothetical protein
MRRYQIYCGEAPQHVVTAPDVLQAVIKWTDQQGYDSVGEAARENFCKPSEITAVELTGDDYADL